MSETEKINNAIEYIEKNKVMKESRYNFFDLNDITYEYFVNADKLLEILTNNITE